MKPSEWHGLTQQAEHRPWPLPERPWIMTMAWIDLLFAHWPLSPEAIRPLVPESLELDTFDDQAWISVVPFRMESVGPRGLHWLPARLPGPRAFPELNVRTYVVRDGQPGVFFLSLDATSPLAIWGARTFFHLPYYRAHIRMDESEGWIEYHSERHDPRLGAGVFRGRYRGIGERLEVRPGSLESWLTERYGLYAVDSAGKSYRGDIHHHPWPLYAAEAEIETNTVAEAHGLSLEGDPLCHFSQNLPVLAWWLAG